MSDRDNWRPECSPRDTGPNRTKKESKPEEVEPDWKETPVGRMLQLIDSGEVQVTHDNSEQTRVIMDKILLRMPEVVKKIKDFLKEKESSLGRKLTKDEKDKFTTEKRQELIFELTREILEGE